MEIRTKTLDLNLMSDCEHINTTVASIAKEIGLNRNKQKITLKLILLNLYYHRGNKLITPRGKNSFGPSRYNLYELGHSSLRKVLDALVKHNYIEQELGMKNLANGEGKMTTVVSTDKLDTRFYRDEWQYYEVDHADTVEVILLKKYKSNNTKDKVLVDYTDGPRSSQMRKDMHSYINLISGSNISAESPNGEFWEYDDEPIYRTFIDMGLHEKDGIELLGFGGRVYAPWCSLPKYLRQLINIDGEKTVELDFQASHVNTLYRKETGKQYKGGDPYALNVGDTIIPRHVVKTLSSILTNVDSYKSAALAIRKHYKLSGEYKQKEEQQSQEFFSILEQVTIRNITDAYLDKHRVIDFYFLKGKMMGASIQYMESCIVMNVVNELTARGIPVLTVFDSFIVVKKHEDLLKELMCSVSNTYSSAA